MQDILTYSAIILTTGVLLFRLIRSLRSRQQTSPGCHGCGCSGCGLKEACKK